MKFIPIAEPVIGKEEEKLTLACIRSTWISSTGEFLGKFEKKYADFIHVPYATTCANGTAALHLALLGYGIKTGDEVILPALTFVSTANVIRYCGADPVFVDIDEKTWNIDVNQIEKKITSRTRAIIPVHLYGYPAPMDRIIKIAKKHHLVVIEDAAEAHGAIYKQKLIGSIGDVGCFSFYGNKIITTGEGGMVTTKKLRIYKKILLYKNHGMSEKIKYFHPVIGYNYRMTNLQAALGLAQLAKINAFLDKRDHIANLYRKLLSPVAGIVMQPPPTADSKPVCWLFSLTITPEYKKSRQALQDYLYTQGIDSRRFFYPVIDLPMYRTKEKFPVTKRISDQGLSLPSSPNLTDKQIKFIVDKIQLFAKL